MADKSPESGGSRLKRIINKLEEQEVKAAAPGVGAPQAPAHAPLEAAPALAPTPAQAEAAPEKAAARRPWRFGEAFKNFAIVFSFVVNLILLLAVILLGLYVFEIKRAIAQPLLGGLYNGFVAMDQAHIQTTIPVNTSLQVDDSIPVVFDLPLQQNTVVTLTQATLIRGASVSIDGGVLQLNDAPTTILLPRGTVLPVALNLTVPVSQTVPVALTVPVNIPVPVDIPLRETQLHEPFTDLRDLFGPYYVSVARLPDSWAELLTGQRP